MTIQREKHEVMPGHAKMQKTSVSLNRKHLRALKKLAKLRKRSVSFILQEIVENEAKRLDAFKNDGELPVYEATTQRKTQSMKLKLLLSLALATSVHAHIVGIGDINLTGNFTLNHLYSFNELNGQPFGWFGEQTVFSSSGIFAPYVHQGETIGPAVLFASGQPPPPLTFSLGGFDFLGFGAGITGSDGRRTVGILTTLSGNGFPQDPEHFAGWNFIAPRYDIGNFPEDITGPINLRFVASFDNGHVPDGGNTALLLSLPLAGLGLWKRKCQSQPKST